MKIKAMLALAICAGLAFFCSAFAQDLGPPFTKLGDGIYVYVGKNFNSTVASC